MLLDDIGINMGCRVEVEIDQYCNTYRTGLLDKDGEPMFMTQGFYHTDANKKFPKLYMEQRLWLEDRDIKYIWTGDYYLFYNANDAVQFKLVWR